MKQAIGWIVLVILVLISLGLSTANYWQSAKLTQELGAMQMRSTRAARDAEELSKLVAQLQKNPSALIQNSSLENEVSQDSGELLAQDVPWATSDDGQLQVKLTAERDVNRPGQPLNLALVVKNNHRQTLTIDTPMFDLWDIDLSRDGQRVRFRGAVPDPALPRPLTLQPGEVARFTLKLTSEDFFELANDGAFRVEFTYRSGFANTWKGSIGPLTARWVNELDR